MIRYRIEMPQAVRTLIRQLPPELKSKVKIGLRSIADDPYRAKGLRDELAGLRSYRIGRPRVDIYERAATELSKALRKDKPQ